MTLFWDSFAAYDLYSGRGLWDLRGLWAVLAIVLGLLRHARSRLAHYPMLGTRIGAFVLVRKLGQGGMGVVYEAQHQQLNLRVAIKLLIAAPADAAATGRALAEAEALCAVQHPGVVRVSDFGQLPDGPVYLVMEYLHGESLRERLRRLPGPQPIAQALGLTRQVAAALAAVHARGIIHRDLTPANLLLVADPELAHLPEQARVKVLDFGIARFSQPKPGAIVEPELLAGTPRYMSPEQCRATAPVSPKSDVYALGVILFELLAGGPPYEIPDSDTQALLDAHQYQRARPLAALRPDVPADIDRLVAAMLAKNAARRPTMSEVAERLQASLQTLVSPPAAIHVESPAAAKVEPPPARQTLTRPGPLDDSGLPSLGHRVRYFLRHGNQKSLLRWAAAALLLLALAAAVRRSLRPADACRRTTAPSGMVCVPGGNFQMGSTQAEIAAAYSDCQRFFDKCNELSYLAEGPPRQVSLSSFLLAQHEVTNAEFTIWLNHPGHQFTVTNGRQVHDQKKLLFDLHPVMNGIAYQPQRPTNRFTVRPGFEHRPVVYVSWYGANAYCREHGWELPTEAQWEWAAKEAYFGSRLAAVGIWPWGNAPPTCDGVVFARTKDGKCSYLPPGPAEVGRAATDLTPRGIFDLGGNVEEWVRDRFVAPYRDCGRCFNPYERAIPDSDGTEVYAVRGGNWAEVATSLRVTARTKSPAHYLSSALGFRCASSLAE